ncbi:MAG: tRNA preQ1(34) S-adenosylmethionine ribosyltransferase-isomerase QueA [Gammaproteobacteria bacterium TMED78]|nr:MAG: tRNA preQ1(34) S-adenosylmethionine ribosyltransferase-isomerase QueA [Gammaproteobacteria bacterium TMED78]|tara:strand:+ start:115 stop:1140 length:1026 start_codon:yes stop_codon:yes gene_type:complete
MKLKEFDYKLPVELIAQEPISKRTSSRLLVLDGNSGHYQDKKFIDLIDILRPSDLIIFNDTKVIKARLYGSKETGGRVELLVERVVSNHLVRCQIKFSGNLSVGSKLILSSNEIATIIERHDGIFFLSFDCNAYLFIDKFGSIPLPPYIKRKPHKEDAIRYQTVYARNQGAIAAPTAGLHFTKEYLSLLAENGIEYDFLTLHVGAGTFSPIRSENILEHKLHEERVIISDNLCKKIIETKNNNGRIIAIGTTCLRALESALASGYVKGFDNKTNLFIYPGYKFKIVDAMLTNFHLPKSSLLLLVSAFAGKENILSAYKYAIQKKYRFFSYGDAMFITLKNS